MTEATNAPLTMETIKPGTAVTGTVTRLTLYGAMIAIGLESEAVLHRSQVGRSDFRNLEEIFNVGDEIEAFVLKVDREGGYVALTTVRPPDVTWDEIRKGRVYKGRVTRIEKFGAFVDIGAERPGMVHVSELTDGYVESPDDVVKVGDEVEVRVIELNRKRRQIDLSMKMPSEEIAQALEPDEEVPTAMALALRRAMSDDGEESRAEEPNSRNKRRKGAPSGQDDIFSRTLREHGKS